MFEHVTVRGPGRSREVERWTADERVVARGDSSGPAPTASATQPEPAAGQLSRLLANDLPLLRYPAPPAHVCDLARPWRRVVPVHGMPGYEAEVEGSGQAPFTTLRLRRDGVVVASARFAWARRARSYDLLERVVSAPGVV